MLSIRRALNGGPLTPFSPQFPLSLPNLACWYAANVNGSLHSDGAASFASASSQYFSLASAPVTITGAWTITFWFKPADADSTRRFLICSNNGGAYSWRIERYSDNALRFGYSGDLSVGGAISTGTWYYIAISYDGAGNGSAQLNNGTAATGAIGTIAASTTFIIGANQLGDSAFANGNMDAIKVWGRVLTAGEITTDYNSGNGVAAKNNTISGCVAGWDFDGPSANLVKDYIGSNTLTNNAVVTYAAGQVSTATLVDGDAVSQWDDLSGNLRHLLQASASLRPLYKVNVQNGKPIVRFDGVDDYMQVTFATTSPMSTFFAGRMDNAQGNNNGYFYDGTTANNRLLSNFLTQTSVAAFAGVLLSTTAANNVFNSYVVVYGPSGIINVNGTETGGDLGTQAGNGITIGATAGPPDLFANCYIGEMGLTVGALTQATRAQLLAYQKNKWATP